MQPRVSQQKNKQQVEQSRFGSYLFTYLLIIRPSKAQKVCFVTVLGWRTKGLSPTPTPVPTPMLLCNTVTGMHVTCIIHIKSLHVKSHLYCNFSWLQVFTRQWMNSRHERMSLTCIMYTIILNFGCLARSHVYTHALAICHVPKYLQVWLCYISIFHLLLDAYNHSHLLL